MVDKSCRQPDGSLEKCRSRYNLADQRDALTAIGDGPWWTCPGLQHPPLTEIGGVLFALGVVPLRCSSCAQVGKGRQAERQGCLANTLNSQLGAPFGMSALGRQHG